MEDNTFMRFQIFLIRNYAKIILKIYPQKTEEEVELGFVEKYSPTLRILNNNIKYLINIFKKITKNWNKNN